MRVLIIESYPGMALALNSMADNHEIVALNFELTAGDAPPESVMLVPAGSNVAGRDGRSWGNPDPYGILDFFAINALDIPWDIEHATQHKAPKGEAAPAMAWCKSLEVKPDGSVWGAVAWNSAGAELVTSQQYRYYSPAYIIDRATNNIVGIKSVGLTNTPNLEVPALNQEQEKGVTMNLVALLAALGLAPTATFDDALNSITRMRGDLTTALNSANSPSLANFVPRADHDLALNRATAAEEKLAALAKETLETAINTEIDAALTAGKITPATKEYHIAQCRQEGGLDRFRDYVKAAPAVLADSDLSTKKPGDTETALNAEEAKIAAMFGNSVEDIGKYGKA